MDEHSPPPQRPWYIITLGLASRRARAHTRINEMPRDGQTTRILKLSNTRKFILLFFGSIWALWPFGPRISPAWCAEAMTRGREYPQRDMQKVMRSRVGVLPAHNKQHLCPEMEPMQGQGSPPVCTPGNLPPPFSSLGYLEYKYRTCGLTVTYPRVGGGPGEPGLAGLWGSWGNGAFRHLLWGRLCRLKGP